MATLDGSIAEASGVMRGGFNNKRASLGFVEKDTSERLEKVEAEVAELEGVLANVEMKRDGNDQEIGNLRKVKAELEGEIIKLEKTLHLDKADLDATSQTKKDLTQRDKECELEIREIQKTIGLHNRELASFKSKKQMLRSEMSQLRNPRVLAQLTSFEEAKQKCREDLVRLENEIKNNSQQSSHMIAPEREKILEIIKQHDKEEKDFHEEITHLSNNIKQQESEL